MIDLESVKARVETPAFVYDEGAITRKLSVVASIRAEAGCKVLYALKPFSIASVLRVMRTRLDGFAASSLFEAALARDILGRRGSVHITTPGFRHAELKELDGLCDYVVFNSLSQWQRFRGEMSAKSKCGLRINPGYSIVADHRYNPCRPASKLGAPIEELARLTRHAPASLEGLGGLHFHTNCDSKSFLPWLTTVELIDQRLERLLRRVSWINLGGGYLFDAPEELGTLARAVDLLRSKYGIEVFIEPGATFVRDAGYIIATVIDMFTSDGHTIALLDTTVSHMPEVFEYQFEPEVLGGDEESAFEYVLAGCTCLAGDVFGLYGFAQPLEIGSRVVFGAVGALHDGEVAHVQWNQPAGNLCLDRLARACSEKEIYIPRLSGAMRRVSDVAA